MAEAGREEEGQNQVYSRSPCCYSWHLHDEWRQRGRVEYEVLQLLKAVVVPLVDVHPYTHTLSKTSLLFNLIINFTSNHTFQNGFLGFVLLSVPRLPSRLTLQQITARNRTSRSTTTTTSRRTRLALAMSS